MSGGPGLHAPSAPVGPPPEKSDGESRDRRKAVLRQARHLLRLLARVARPERAASPQGLRDRTALRKAKRALAEAAQGLGDGFALFDASERLLFHNIPLVHSLPQPGPDLRPGLSYGDFHARLGEAMPAALPCPLVEVPLTGGGKAVFLPHPASDVAEQGLVTDPDRPARLIRATLDHIQQGIGIFDEAGRLVCWNRRLATLLGIPPGQLVAGMAFGAVADLVDPDARGGDELRFRDLLPLARQRAEGAPVSFEWQHDGGVVLDVFARHMPGQGVVLSCADVTRERLAVHAMLRANASLEARVAARTEDLAAALAAAERAHAARVRFVAAASHDLLQPLSAAKLFIAAARDEAEAPRLRATLDKAHNALVGVEAILGALLDISRLDSGRTAVEIAPVPLAVLLAQLRDEFAPLAARKGLRLSVVASSQTVLSDPTYLRRILQNLISNAIRYTGSGRVLVGLRRAGPRLRLEVHDTGPGIAEEEQQAIFREFHRLSGAASASEGMGLGLAIVERACALLDHRLTLASRLGRGTCFAIELDPGPAKPRALAGPAPDIHPEPGDFSDRIALLVENDGELRRAIALLLERRGVGVLEAASGEEALELLEEIGIVPDLYLIDQQLGAGLSGVETAQSLFARFGERPTRIVTANRTAETLAAASEAGLEIIHKPIDPERLEAFVLQAG